MLALLILLVTGIVFVIVEHREQAKRHRPEAANEELPDNVVRFKGRK